MEFLSCRQQRFWIAVHQSVLLQRIWTDTLPAPRRVPWRLQLLPAFSFSHRASIRRPQHPVHALIGKAK